MPDDKTISERVAEACGWQVEGRRFDGRRGVWLKLPDDDFGEEGFDPEHDANDAVRAAEKFGLMYQNCELHGLTLPDGTHGWAVWRNTANVWEPEMIGSGSFCTAVCAAILRLAETR